ncbi:MAG TPA: lysozyme inhibitor LprI family protein [Mycobacteriales bacterium]|nr:lysozyme inhibitor LprI family protein [Mycobacteriales bacterium]
MRIAASGPAVLLIAGLAAAGCASSSSGGNPPVPSTAPPAAAALPTIPEKFTLLPCPSPAKTTLALEGCAEHRIVALDAQVSSTAREVYAGVQTGAEQQQVVQSLTAWIAARSAACTKAMQKYAGGTLAPVAYANCEVTQDNKELTALHAITGSTSP